VCERCGRVEAVDPAVMDPLRDALAADTGFRARFTHFPLHGHCAACVKDLGL
jgi:Fur family transcriptional regulator, ferric uptake regulator